MLYTCKGRRFDLECVKHNNNPILTEGWLRIREAYCLQHHHEILFKYLGTTPNRDSVFHFIVDVDRKTNPNEFPTWHSRSKALRKSKAFVLTIVQDPSQIDELVEY